MAPKSGEKKPAKKVVKKTGASAGDKKKKVSRKAVESYKIYIYKVGFCAMQQHVECCALLWQLNMLMSFTSQAELLTRCHHHAGAQAGPP